MKENNVYFVNQRNKLKPFLDKRLIETKVFNDPLACDAPIYQQYNLHSLPVAREMLKKNLILPSHEMLNMEQIEFLISSLKDFYSNP